MVGILNMSFILMWDTLTEICKYVGIVQSETEGG